MTMSTEEIDKTIKHIGDVISDNITDFLYYDRKNDEELPVGVIDQLVDNNFITIDKLVAIFKEELVAGLRQEDDNI